MAEQNEDPSCDLFKQVMALSDSTPLSRQRSEDCGGGFAPLRRGNTLRTQRSMHIDPSLFEDYLNEASELQNNGAFEEALRVHEKL